MDLRPDQHRSLFHKGRRRDLLVHVGAMDAPEISMGSTYAIRLAFLLRNRVGEYFRCSGSNAASAKVMTNPNDEARNKVEYRSPKSW
jgi:hypothetical protein